MQSEPRIFSEIKNKSIFFNNNSLLRPKHNWADSALTKLKTICDTKRVLRNYFHCAWRFSPRWRYLAKFAQLLWKWTRERRWLAVCEVFLRFRWEKHDIECSTIYIGACEHPGHHCTCFRVGLDGFYNISLRWRKRRSCLRGQDYRGPGVTSQLIGLLAFRNHGLRRDNSRASWGLSMWHGELPYFLFFVRTWLL